MQGSDSHTNFILTVHPVTRQLLNRAPVSFITAIFRLPFFLARKTPKLLYNVTTVVFLVATSLAVTLLWHCSEILSPQVDFLAILCCHSLKNQRVFPYSQCKSHCSFVVEFFAYIERNWLEILIRRLVVTFALYIDVNFSWQEATTTWNHEAVIKGTPSLNRCYVNEWTPLFGGMLWF